MSFFSKARGWASTIRNVLTTPINRQWFNRPPLPEPVEEAQAEVNNGPERKSRVYVRRYMGSFNLMPDGYGGVKRIHAKWPANGHRP